MTEFVSMVPEPRFAVRVRPTSWLESEMTSSGRYSSGTSLAVKSWALSFVPALSEEAATKTWVLFAGRGANA